MVKAVMTSIRGMYQIDKGIGGDEVSMNVSDYPDVQDVARRQRQEEGFWILGGKELREVRCGVCAIYTRLSGRVSNDVLSYPIPPHDDIHTAVSPWM
jgi:hypothetical protein